MSKTKNSLLFALFLLVLCVPAAAGNLRVAVLSVGQGLSVVTESPDGRVMVFDCGSENPRFDSANTNRTVRYLRFRGVRKLDAVVLSHADSDHSSGMDVLLKNYKAKTFITGKAVLADKRFAAVERALKKQKTPIRCPASGESFSLGRQVKVRVVSPGVSGKGNTGSLALLVKYGSESFLLTSDMGKKEEAAMCRRFGSGLAASVLLVPHHGSSGSCSQALLRAARPRAAAISCGRRNKYGHPSFGVLKRLSDNKIRVLMTARDGDIVFVSDGKRTGFVKKRKKALFSDIWSK